MNFQALYATERVVVATYRTLSTAVLLFYLVKRIKEGRAQTVRMRQFDR